MGGAGAIADASIKTAQMILRVVTLPLLLMVWAHNFYGEVTVQVVPASTEPMGYIPKDATHMSSYLLLLLWCSKSIAC